MSIDLEWHKLDTSLSSSLVDLLNRQLASTTRPSFIGPVEVTSLDFGTASPDVELVDLRDVYRDFLEDEDDNEDVDPETVKVTEGADDEEGFEWVSRKTARAHSLVEELPAYHLLPPHVRYGHGPLMDMHSSLPNLPSSRGGWSPALANLTELRPAFPYASGYASPLFRPSLSSLTPRPSFGSVLSPKYNLDNSASPADKEPLSTTPSSPKLAKPPSTPQNQPNLQMHLHISWRSNLRITFTTSLLINYPSPMFMSLPIKLSVTGLIFEGEIAVAYEGERKRIHLCILDELDPYGPLAGDRPKRDSPASGSTPTENEDDTPVNSSGPTRTTKPIPIGQRLLPSIIIESEIGQADKHVLKNVTRVERFIQDVIRKTIEEELVFPNFHTLVLPDA
ncbi:hypothetical protein PHLCEN_2v7779 [Hermanssonia centrifuga]|uniref:Mitochondrial distribution and morphology protein 12 n=1 Tax=Hermanssonia centrifuga TaxID=98765 RepID=A0A2R6NW16_9APHY|nr:hypothetical protein PHLCEN_2v7779 [Hermanssonia centrifuga]